VTEPLVFQHGAARTTFDIALGIWVIFEGVMQVRQRLLLGGRAARDPSVIALLVCIWGAIFAALALGRAGSAPLPGGRVWPLAAGLVLIAVGIGLRAWSIATLGRFFQYRIVVQPDHRVVTTGPYRWVRHPSYSGLALVLCGIALATGDILSMVVVVILAGVGLAVRIRAEEQQLNQALGEQYRSFAAQHKRLVPGIW
jgi:protein-S-isoprenylcysteine O-methyltransferase Ste14